ncbi:hypothetical protein CAPTEDRAFT_200684 [Capitella teleta]|uniref:Mab-21-like HhH/H2TH-like domain-containing protein n=1 Tax=Capitella teleta TaxID=283909 RepID=R7UN42_CAPTE|nr:hypothetical protein CAPTEDRAFT_200684 [Capitella teleta]|eukprot:ELU07615.1 hypothetical protein CAPTEDRAFT_200684 [Capitella teleta]
MSCDLPQKIGNNNCSTKTSIKIFLQNCIVWWHTTLKTQLKPNKKVAAIEQNCRTFAQWRRALKRWIRKRWAIRQKMSSLSTTDSSTSAWGGGGRASLKAKRKSRKSVRSSRSDMLSSLPDIFECHQLIDSPRRVQYERTQLTIQTPLAAALDIFYLDVANICQGELDELTTRAKDLCTYIYQRVIKRGYQIGIRLQKPVFLGSAFDDTAVVSLNEVDILMPFECLDASLDSAEAGYYVIPLKPFKEQKGEPPDPHRYGRSEDGMHLSSMVVAKNIHSLLVRVLRYHPWAELLPFTVADGQSQITVSWKAKQFFNLIPATRVHGEDFHLVSRPYPLDDHPQSELLWRGCFSVKEAKILQRINKADRGIRCKAFKLLKTLIKIEPTLVGLTSYHLKTVLLHSFDCIVDSIPRWHKDGVDIAFQCLLEELLHFLTIKNLPHFFINEYNLLGGLGSRRLAVLRARINFLHNNSNELSRLLQKHCNKKQKMKMSIEETE